jgi:hypothetical protein
MEAETPRKIHDCIERVHVETRQRIYLTSADFPLSTKAALVYAVKF